MKRSVASYQLPVVAVASVLALLLAGCGASAPAPAASPTAAPMAAPEVHSVQAFLQTLPAASTPPLTEMEAMTLAAYPLSCLDNIQAQPGGRFSGPPAATPAPARAAAPASAVSAPSARRRPASAAGGLRGYLWQSSGASTLLPGYARERSFYGCYDWHSSVNSTWTLVTLLQRYPNLPMDKLIREKLDSHLGKSNLAGELAYFEQSKRFELPYGQAWLLKLYASLLSWNDPDAKKWAANMAPLAEFFSKNVASYLTKLPTPVRTGVHPNTAFDMDLMLPYTAIAKDTALHQAIVATATRFYANDRQCPTGYEPAGVSFLSPCLVEAALMAHVLPPAQFLSWYNNFMPEVYSAAFHPLVSPFDASKMTKDQMAGQSHLIGLAFSRAAAMLTIAQALPAGDARIPVLRRLAAIHAVAGFKTMDEAGYLETHWIATYALLYQLRASPPPVSGNRVAAAASN